MWGLEEEVTVKGFGHGALAARVRLQGPSNHTSPVHIVVAERRVQRNKKILVATLLSGCCIWGFNFKVCCL